jgi:hypothetical protein
MVMLAPLPQLKTEAPDSELCWALVERVASSTPFRRAARLREFLLYVSRRLLKDGRDKIQENEIGTAVFDRPADYDTNIDPIVRVNATELRKRIDAFFEAEGLNETIIMEIPRGGYTPVFRHRPVQALPPTVETPVPAVLPVSPSSEKNSEAEPVSGYQRWIFAGQIVAGVMIIVLAAGCLFFWTQNRAWRQLLYAWQDKPSVSAFWSEIFSASPDTDVVVADASFGLTQDISKMNFPLNDYLSHSYMDQLKANKDLDTDTHAALNRIVAWNLESQDDIKLARRLLALDPLGKNMHFYSARDYMPDLIKRDNVILIGGLLSNPWDELYEGRMNFTAIFGSNGLISVKNRAPATVEQTIYTQTGPVGYCVIAYLPNPDHNGIVLLIEGTSAEATEAAGDFLLSEDELAGFKKTLNRQKLPYFEVLLKVSSVRNTPLTAAIEAYRTYPNLH